VDIPKPSEFDWGSIKILLAAAATAPPKLQSICAPNGTFRLLRLVLTKHSLNLEQYRDEDSENILEGEDALSDRVASPGGTMTVWYSKICID